MPTALLPSSSFAASSFSSGPCLIRHAHWDFQHHSRQRKQPGRCAVCRVLCTPGSIVRLSVLCKPRCKTAAVFSPLQWVLSPWLLHGWIVATSRLLSDPLVCSVDGRAPPNLAGGHRCIRPPAPSRSIHRVPNLSSGASLQKHPTCQHPPSISKS